MTQTVVPVELSLSRDLLVRLVTANIAALHRHSELLGAVGVAPRRRRRKAA